MILPPPRARITGAAACEHSHRPRRFTASSASQSSRVYSTAGLRMMKPAAVMSTSSPPRAATASANSRWISSGRATSAAKGMPRRPRARISAATASTSGRVRAATATSAPADARASAIPRPNPRPPPVTSARRPTSESVSTLPVHPPDLEKIPERARQRLLLPRGDADAAGGRGEPGPAGQVVARQRLLQPEGLVLPERVDPPDRLPDRPGGAGVHEQRGIPDRLPGRPHEGDVGGQVRAHRAPPGLDRTVSLADVAPGCIAAHPEALHEEYADGDR